MEKLEKENVLENFKEMIKESWTFNKMTRHEKITCMEVLNHERTARILKGSYRQRWDILDTIYFGYLKGLDYNGYNWREGKEETLF